MMPVEEKFSSYSRYILFFFFFWCISFFIFLFSDPHLTSSLQTWEHNRTSHSEKNSWSGKSCWLPNSIPKKVWAVQKHKTYLLTHSPSWQIAFCTLQHLHIFGPHIKQSFLFMRCITGKVLFHLSFKTPIVPLRAEGSFKKCLGRLAAYEQLFIVFLHCICF